MIWIFWDSLDASFNPWSMTRQEWLRRIEFLEQANAELSGRVENMKETINMQQDCVKKMNQALEEIVLHLGELNADQDRLLDIMGKLQGSAQNL
jgi:chromosome segregation ATPase